MNELDDFGKVEFVKSKNARRITIRIHPDGIKVSLPMLSNKSDATHFILQNKKRILLKQEKIRTRKSTTYITTEKEITTQTFTIIAIQVNRENIHFYLKEGVLKIEVPVDADLSSNNVQQTCWDGIQYFLRKEAKRILPDRVSELAQQFGFSYTGVKIQSSKTRWGSCSQKQNINLSFYLLLLPRHLSDYVILHELCHTLEMNHSNRFRELMNKVTDGKADRLRREIKAYSIPQ